MNYRIAPSSYVAESDVCDLFQAIFGINFLSVIQYIHLACENRLFLDEDTTTSKDFEGLIPTLNESLKPATKMLDENVIMANEFSLHGMLQMFSSQIARCFTKRFEGVFYVLIEYKFVKGFKYSMDGAVVCNGPKPVLMYELKEKVATHLVDQSDDNLRTIFIQAFYIRKLNVWHCLTDMHDFHYFKYEPNKEDYLKIKHYVYIETDITNSQSCAKHISLIKQLYKK